MSESNKILLYWEKGTLLEAPRLYYNELFRRTPNGYYVVAIGKIGMFRWRFFIHNVPNLVVSKRTFYAINRWHALNHCDKVLMKLKYELLSEEKSNKIRLLM